MRRFAMAAALALLAAGAFLPADAAPRFRPVRDDVFYMYMPIAWRDSDADPWRFGDFGGMTASIPYLKALEVTAVWMTPIFASPAYHGYQHGRADSLNPRFGDEPQFWSFVQAAHAESIKVFIDLVAYGISQNSVWFQDSHANPASVYDSWLAYTDASNTSYLGCCPYPTWDGETVGFIHWNLDNPAVTQMVTAWSEHWLDPNGDGDPSDGIDGFRADHVSYYDATEGAWGYTIDWWQRWKDALKSVDPDVFTFAEQADWSSYGYELQPAFDAAFTKPFESAARYGLAYSDGRPLAGSMETTQALQSDGRLYLATIGNHDVDRIATVLGGDARRARAAAAVLMLQPLPPVIYFGDEIGMRGAKRTDYAGDAADIPNREPFKWNATAGPPMSNYFALNAQAYANRLSQDGDGRSVEEQSGVPGSLLEAYRALSALRHAHPALRRGDYFTVTTPDTSMWTFLKIAPEETLLVAIHLGAGALTTHVDLSSVDPPGGSAPVTDVESGAALTPITAANRAAYPLDLAAYGYRVLRAAISPRDLRPLYADANVVVTQVSPTPLDDFFELDQMFVRYEPQALALALTGNLADGGYGLALFIDALPGGQSTLQTQGMPEPPTGVAELAGLTFDTGFVPEKILFINLYSGQLYADLFTLATGGGGSKRYLGTIPVGMIGPLSGGDVPGDSVRVSYGGSNRHGVTATSAADAATATDGFQIRIPWTDLGLSGPGPDLRLMAMLTIPNGAVYNQFLPGVITPTVFFGAPPLDLNTIAGQQYVDLGSTTAALVTLESKRQTAGAVEIVWRMGGVREPLVVQRQGPDTGWLPFAQVVPDAQGIVRVTDSGAVAGARYGYRLVSAAGVLDETWVDVTKAAVALALRAVTAEAGSGRLRVSFVAAGGAPVRVEAFDVLGRRIEARDLGVLEPGEHAAILGAGGLRSGLYFVRLREGAATLRGRAVLVR